MTVNNGFFKKKNQNIRKYPCFVFVIKSSQTPGENQEPDPTLINLIDTANFYYFLKPEYEGHANTFSSAGLPKKFLSTFLLTEDELNILQFNVVRMNDARDKICYRCVKENINIVNHK